MAGASLGAVSSQSRESPQAPSLAPAAKVSSSQHVYGLYLVPKTQSSEYDSSSHQSSLPPSDTQRKIFEKARPHSTRGGSRSKNGQWGVHWARGVSSLLGSARGAGHGARERAWPQSHRAGRAGKEAELRVASRPRRGLSVPTEIAGNWAWV